MTAESYSELYAELEAIAVAARDLEVPGRRLRDLRKGWRYDQELRRLCDRVETLEGRLGLALCSPRSDEESREARALLFQAEELGRLLARTRPEELARVLVAVGLVPEREVSVSRKPRSRLSPLA